MENIQRVPILFEDLSYTSTYEFLEWGKDDKEMLDVAAKRGIQLPSKDLAIFKGRYAMVDKQNKNKCTLPRREVKRALKSLNGKAIDKDHYRKNTIGVWLDAELDDNEIISYGSFWKSNFPDDYEEIKRRMAEGKMKISFEAWGDRIYKDSGGYDLVNIEFAGGALLFDTEPAFPSAEILEMSQKVLEFAKVMEQDSEEWEIEEARLSFYRDGESIARIVSETECPSCKERIFCDVKNIDFEKSKVTCKCNRCGAVYDIDLTPSTIIRRKGKKPKDNTIGTKEIILEKLGDIEETDLLKRHEKGGIIEVDELIINEVELLQEKPEDVEVSAIPQEVLTRVKELVKEGKPMKEAMKQAWDEYKKAHPAKSSEDEIKNLKDQLIQKDQEIATLKVDKDNLIAENNTLKQEVATVKTELDRRIAEEKSAKIKVRKDELGEEYTKDLSDEDILDDVKFENAKLKKENVILKKEKKDTKPATAGLEAGATILDPQSPAFTKQTNIQEKAWKDK